MQHSIGTYQEYSLHEDLKHHYTSASGKTEVRIENYIIDVVNNNHLIEIQTANFSQIREKLKYLLQKRYEITLVHPIYEEKVFRSKIEDRVSVRTSSKRDNLLTSFNELVYIPELFLYPNFSLDIVFTKIEIQRKKIKNKYKTEDKKLLEIKRIVKFSSIEDLLFILPYDLQLRMSTKSLMQRLGITYPLASKIIYFFVKTDVLKMIEKESNLKIYQVKKK